MNEKMDFSSLKAKSTYLLRSTFFKLKILFQITESKDEGKCEVTNI